MYRMDVVQRKQNVFIFILNLCYCGSFGDVRGKRKLIQMIFRQIQNTLGVSGAGRKGDFAASRVFTSAIKIK